jgi:tetratricopeptide (TPR) repeat protein
MAKTFLLLVLTGLLYLLAGVGAAWKWYNHAGLSAYQRGDYAEAAKQWEAALKEAQDFGEQDPRLATSLNNLALLYHAQGRYGDAEPLYKRARDPRKGLGASAPGCRPKPRQSGGAL